MPEWVSAIVTILTVLVICSVAYGYNKKHREALESTLDDKADRSDTEALSKELRETTDRHNKYHYDHFQHAKVDEEHFRDTELHPVRPGSNDFGVRLVCPGKFIGLFKCGLVEPLEPK